VTLCIVEHQTFSHTNFLENLILFYFLIVFYFMIIVYYRYESMAATDS